MDKEIECFDKRCGATTASKIEMIYEGTLKTKLLSLRNATSGLSNTETVSLKSSSAAVKLPESIDDIYASTFITLKPDSKASPTLKNNLVTAKSGSKSTSEVSLVSTSKIDFPETLKVSYPETSKVGYPETSKVGYPEILKISSLKLCIALDKSATEDKELLESISLLKEEIEEMLNLIFRAKQKLEFFISHLEGLAQTLQEISQDVFENGLKRNMYVKNMYRRKLEEFASSLTCKVKKSIEYLDDQYNTLIEQFHQISNNDKNNKKTFSNGTVDNLLEEIYSSKSRQLSEIKNTSCIEEDIEMLYDLIYRFSSIVFPNFTSGFNLMQKTT